MDLTQGPMPVLSYRCFFRVRCIQMPCCCPFPYSVAYPSKLLDCCYCILLEVISNHTHWLLCFTVSVQNSSCKYSLGLGWVFCFARGKPQIFSGCAFAIYVSSDGAHGCRLALAPVFFICVHAYICLAVRLLVMLT